jgi:hypothetical protein
LSAVLFGTLHSHSFVPFHQSLAPFQPPHPHAERPREKY